MTAILAWLSGKGTALAVGAAIPLVLMFAKKLIPSKIGEIFGNMLGKQMARVEDIKDPIERGLVMSIVLDLVRYAEYKIPDPKSGEDKYKMVADKLCAIVPILKGQEAKIEELIEAAVKAMDDELKKQIPGPIN